MKDRPFPRRRTSANPAQRTPQPDSDDLKSLLEMIHHCFQRRGFYLLMDDRLKLICGDDYSGENTVSKTNAVAAFAEEHGFCGLIIDGIATFTPRSSVEGELGQKEAASRFPIDTRFPVRSASAELPTSRVPSNGCDS